MAPGIHANGTCVFAILRWMPIVDLFVIFFQSFNLIYQCCQLPNQYCVHRQLRCGILIDTNLNVSKILIWDADSSFFLPSMSSVASYQKKRIFLAKLLSTSRAKLKNETEEVTYFCHFNDASTCRRLKLKKNYVMLLVDDNRLRNSRSRYLPDSDVSGLPDQKKKQYFNRRRYYFIFFTK